MVESRNARADSTLEEASREFWGNVLCLFPFLFLPTVAFLGLLSSFVMPYLTGLYSR